MVKAMDFESEEDCVHVRFPAWTIVFFSLFFLFFNDDDGGATRSGAGERKARAWTCRNERSKCRH